MKHFQFREKVPINDINDIKSACNLLNLISPFLFGIFAEKSEYNVLEYAIEVIV